MDHVLGLALIGIALLCLRGAKNRKAINSMDNGAYSIPAALAEGKQHVGVVNWTCRRSESCA